MGALIDAVGPWVAVLVGVTIIIGGLYGAKKWAERAFGAAVDVVFKPRLDKINEKLDHLHECVEGVKSTLDGHIATDSESFANINARMDRNEDKAQEERAELLLLLRNIQQATVPEPGNG